MTELREINNQQLLNELSERAKKHQIGLKQLEEIFEEIKWREGCRLASKDQERDQEIAEWDKVESKLADE